MTSNLRCVLACFLCYAGLAQAQVTFRFHQGNAMVDAGLAMDDVAGSAEYTVSGVTIAAEAFLDGVSAGTQLNGALEGFGVNASGTGDETQRIDNILGSESIRFSFNKAGTFDSIDLRYVTRENEAVLSFAGGPVIPLNSSNAISLSDDTYSVSASFFAGQVITLSISEVASTNESFSLESITITPIPEPASFAAWSALVAVAVQISRRRSRLG